ncbi:MAG TPA: hypothetical protein VNY27_08765 [Solirubrobacteraceae bacterium]|nr:hypothetical protein [Solirubrobacteraceae bacterium]
MGGRGTLPEVTGYRLADCLPFGVGEGDTAVVVLDRDFYEVDGLVALGALAALVVGADEVLVDAAVAGVLGVDEAAAAGAAADGALEVVLVCAVALAGVVVRGEDGLNLIEELLADQRLVPAGVVLAAVGDDPGVVRAGEHVVDARLAEWLWCAAAIAAGAQAAGIEQRHHVGRAVEAGGVGLEAPANDRRALGVEGDGADFAALG